MLYSKRYSELIRIPTFKDRFEYLKLTGAVGESTFGFDRYLNQLLYKSAKWDKIRGKIIIRDNACDLAMEGYDIPSHIIIHHINPLSMKDIEEVSDKIFDPENLVCVSHRTHNAIHYGDQNLLPQLPIERRPGDTCPWKA